MLSCERMAFVFIPFWNTLYVVLMMLQKFHNDDGIAPGEPSVQAAYNTVIEENLEREYQEKQ